MSLPKNSGPLIEALLSNYAVEADMYQELLYLAREQGNMLRRGEAVAEYAALFPRKDELLRAIGRIELELEPLKRQWWDLGPTPDARERLNRLLDRILVAIDGLRAQETRNEELLASRGAAARQALREARGATSRMAEFAPAAAPCAG